jgi:18S rRNA (adenine1779-N6/adenine1780-N6)-dimethyltransferase
VHSPAKLSFQVGRNNFNPPPQVESSVIRLEPKNPRPAIDYEEWDGLLRIAFVRRNKTISAGFKSSAVMAIIEKNYRTYCAQHGIALDDSPDAGDVDMGDEDDEAMEEEEEGMEVDDDMDGEFDSEKPRVVAKESRRRLKGKVGKLVTEKVRKVLEETELGEQRAGKLDEVDYLRLLSAFNREGIHFS